MTTWTRRFSPPSLAPDEVHLWRADLAGDDADLARDQALLTSDEWARAERFASRVHARRYVRARGTLRRLLCAYLGEPPATLVLRYGAHGKPELQRERRLRFNLSHCGDVAVLGVARVEVGVDIERVRDDVDVSRVAARALPASERAKLQAVPPDRRLHAFFGGWTRQEACLKALGTGWSEGPALEDRLTVLSFDCTDGFPGAIAVAGVPRNLRFFDA